MIDKTYEELVKEYENKYLKKKFNWDIFFSISFVVILIFEAGYMTNTAVRYWGKWIQIQGFYVAEELNLTRQRVIEIAYQKEPLGEWICTNIAGRTPNEILATLKHEVGHEIFAEYCEKENNFDKCLGIADE